MHAVILAGGRGARLRPYTTTLPKPLVPLGDECAIIEVVLRQLSAFGFADVTIAIGHLGSLIQAYVGDGTQWGLRVRYVSEASPLGTMGSVVANLDQLPEHFLVLNGDVLTDIDFADVLHSHIGSGAPLTVGTYRREVSIDFGVLEVRNDRIVGFREKPTLSYAVSMGVYGLSKRTLTAFEPGHALGFDELVLHLLAVGDPPASYPFEGYWLDIGRPEDYDRANEEFERLRPIFLRDS